MRTATSPPAARYGEQLVLNAHCIDFVYGGVYAWAYLAMAGVSDPDIIVILRTPFDSWRSAHPDIATIAHRAMDSIGIQRPIDAYNCTML
jgi:hypothetical protein